MRANRKGSSSKGCLSTSIQSRARDHGAGIAKSDGARRDTGTGGVHGPRKLDRLAELRRIRTRGQAGRGAAQEPDIEDRVKLNAVGRHSRLSVDKVKESNTRDLHRHTDGSKRSGRSETSVKLLSGVGDAGGERTIHCHATR